MNAATQRDIDRLPIRLGWWLIAVTCGLFGAYALSSGFSELLFLLGLGPEEKHRATPVIFVIHPMARGS